MAAACGACCTPEEGSPIAYVYRVSRSRGSGGPGGSCVWPDAAMTDSRAVLVWGQVAAHAAAHGQRPSVADVCAVAVSSAQLSGAWVVAARGGDPDFVMCVTVRSASSWPNSS